MGVFDHTPYTDFHRLNLTWIIKTVQKAVADVQKAIDLAKQYVDSVKPLTNQVQTNTDNIHDLSESKLSIANLDPATEDMLQTVGYNAVTGKLLTSNTFMARFGINTYADIFLNFKMGKNVTVYDGNTNILYTLTSWDNAPTPSWFVFTSVGVNTSGTTVAGLYTIEYAYNITAGRKLLRVIKDYAEDIRQLNESKADKEGKFERIESVTTSENASFKRTGYDFLHIFVKMTFPAGDFPNVAGVYFTAGTARVMAAYLGGGTPGKVQYAMAQADITNGILRCSGSEMKQVNNAVVDWKSNRFDQSPAMATKNIDSVYTLAPVPTGTKIEIWAVRA